MPTRYVLCDEKGQIWLGYRDGSWWRVDRGALTANGWCYLHSGDGERLIEEHRLLVVCLWDN